MLACDYNRPSIDFPFMAVTASLASSSLLNWTKPKPSNWPSDRDKRNQQNMLGQKRYFIPETKTRDNPNLNVGEREGCTMPHFEYLIG